MRKYSDRHSLVLIYICLVIAIIAVYWPVYKYKFVEFDDDVYIINNTNIQSGLNWQSVRWALTTSYFNWHPVTWLSHTLDYQLFKGWAGGHHLTNVLFHILNTLILFYVLMRMTGAVWPSAFVAAAFALHPLHVESVAWISERKDLLSTFFWLLTMWMYVRYVENLKPKWYLATIAMFILGLMSKSMLVTLPFVLLLLDFWPLERKISWRLLTEKIPFFICSLASCVITFLSQRSVGATTALGALKFKERAGNAIISYIAYITKMIWPSRLAVLYPHPGSNLSAAKIIICASLLILLSISFIYLDRRRRFFAFGWLWYLGTLVPVIGFVQVGAQAMADRYTYITLTGLFIIIAWSAKEFVPPQRYKMLVLPAAAVLIILAAAAHAQLRYWKNSITLFEHTLAVTKDNEHILKNYADCLMDAGRLNEAIEQLDKLLKIKPDSAAFRCNLGCALAGTGKIQEAMEHFRLAIEYEPNYLLSYFNLAAVLQNQNRFEEAVSWYKQAIKIKPDYINAHLNLATALVELGRGDEAIEYCNKAIAIEPNSVIAHNHLGMALDAIGRTDEAIKEVRFVLSIRPNDANTHRNLGLLLEKEGKTAEAIKSYRAALQIDPYDVKSRQLLEAALKKQGVSY